MKEILCGIYCIENVINNKIGEIIEKYPINTSVKTMTFKEKIKIIESVFLYLPHYNKINFLYYFVVMDFLVYMVSVFL